MKSHFQRCQNLVQELWKERDGTAQQTIRLMFAGVLALAASRKDEDKEAAEDVSSLKERHHFTPADLLLMEGDSQFFLTTSGQNMELGKESYPWNVYYTTRTANRLMLVGSINTTARRLKKLY